MKKLLFTIALAVSFTTGQSVFAQNLGSPPVPPLNPLIFNQQIKNQILKKQNSKVKVSKKQIAKKIVLNKPVSKAKISKGQISKNHILKDQIPKKQIAKVQVSKDQISQNQIAKKQIAKEQVLKDQVSQIQVAKKQIAKEQVLKDQISQNQVAKKQIAKNQVLIDKISQNQVIKEIPKNTETDTLTQFSKHSNPIGLVYAEDSINKAIVLMQKNRFVEAKSIVEPLYDWLEEATECHTNLYKVLKDIDTAKVQADLERELALKSAILRDSASYQLSLLYIEENDLKKATPKLVDIVRSQPKTQLGFSAYQVLQQIGFTYKMQLTETDQGQTENTQAAK